MIYFQSMRFRNLDVHGKRENISVAQETLGIFLCVSKFYMSTFLPYVTDTIHYTNLTRIYIACILFLVNDREWQEEMAFYCI
jgi:hypothetical protein